MPEQQPKCTLRDAWMALNQQANVFEKEYDRRAFKLLIDTAQRLVNYYDDAGLVSADSPTSGADDAGALYEILNAGGLEVA
jgi:hypothetical protein